MKEEPDVAALIAQPLWLASHVHLVEGTGAWSVMDLAQSEFILTNPSGGRLLRQFRGGARPRTAFSALGLDSDPEALREWAAFIKQAIASDLLSASAPDEVPQPTPRHLSHTSLSLTIELSRRCNLTCLHCYNRSGPKERERLEPTVVCRVLDEVRDLYGSLATLTLTGGEPLLYRGLPSVIEQGLTAGFATVRINTNGTITPNADLLQTLTSNATRVEVQVTLLGADQATHDRVANHQGSYQRLIENTAKFHATGAAVHLSFVKSRLSEHQQAEASAVAGRLDVPIIVNDIFPIGRASDDPSILGGAAGPSKDLVPCDEGRFGGLSPGIITKDKRLAMLQQMPPSMPCGQSTFAVSANGDVLPCVLLQGIVVGSIFQSPICEIVTSREMRTFQSAIAMDNRSGCSGCELRHACGNKCPAVGLSFGGTLGTKSPFCEYRSPEY